MISSKKICSNGTTYFLLTNVSMNSLTSSTIQKQRPKSSMPPRYPKQGLSTIDVVTWYRVLRRSAAAGSANHRRRLAQILRGG